MEEDDAAPSLAEGWAPYWPFQVGASVRLSARLGPMVIRAELEVTEVGADLEFRYHVPPQKVLLRRIPEARGRLRLVVHGGGPSGAIVHQLDGAEPDAPVPMTVRSNPGARTRHLEVDAAGGRRGCAMVRRGDEVALEQMHPLPAFFAGLTIAMRRAD